MKQSHRSLALILVGLLLGCFSSVQAEETLKAGAKIETLVVGQVTYRDVVVRSINTRTLMVTHAGGMASIRLRDLTPDWQERFHYDASAEAAAEQAVANTPTLPTAPRPVKSAAIRISEIDRVLQKFGQPAALREEVNLRPQFVELGLGVRNQGRRPSCSIFAIVSALEFQNARLCGKAENFSEDYLIWATEKTVRRTSRQGLASAATEDDADAGFTLTEVVNALRTYGIPLQDRLPNNGAVGMRGIPDPSPDVISEARAHQKVFVHQVPGRDSITRINNLVHALNAGMPVAIGMAWPNYRSIKNGYLSGQKPMQDAWHAVTLVGYHSKTGRIEDTYFIFKNSWGDYWGQGGYGTVTYGYLTNYLSDAVVLEVQRG